MKIVLGSFYIEINPFFGLIIVIAFFCGYLPQFFIVFMSTVLHEAGHIAVALLSGMKLNAIKIHPAGFNALINMAECNKLTSVFIYISGPLINYTIFVLFIMLSTFNGVEPGTLRFIAFSNLYLGLFNTIPVLPLDGGKILRELLKVKIGLFSAYNSLKLFSAVLSVAFFIPGILLLFSGVYNFSLLLSGMYIFYSVRTEEAREAAFMNIKNLIFRRSRLLKKGLYPARDIVAIRTIELGEVLRHMDFDRFHFIYVLDEDLKLLKIFTEQEILDSSIKYGIEFSLDKLIAKCIEDEIKPASGRGEP